MNRVQWGGRRDGHRPAQREIDWLAREWARKRGREHPSSMAGSRGEAYTDLVVEAQTALGSLAASGTVPGVETQTRETPVGTVTRMAVTTPEAAQALGKVMGRYSTIESDALRQRNEEAHQQLAQLLAEEIAFFLQYLAIGPEDPVLVVGLGNWDSTPDALGPRVAKSIMVTRHLREMVPPEARGGLRPVASISPGVLGITGIETAEIVYGVVHRIHPALVICIDALAARSTKRLGTTIQMADTGIHPGSGVGNKRFGITRETLGVPVLALGVPTVVRAVTIIADGLEMVARQSAGYDGSGAGSLRPDPFLMWRGSQGAAALGAGFSGAGGGPYLSQAQKEQVLHQLLEPYMGDLIVTPKDVDALVDDIAQTLAAGLNAALHPALDLSNVLQYLN